MSKGLLLDTHALIWIVEGADIAQAARATIASAATEGALFVSAATAWEIGLLRTLPSVPSGMRHDPRRWLSTAMAMTRAAPIDLDAELMLAVSALPEPLHRDPADRMIIATARTRDLILMTRDRAILSYAALGHVRAVAC